ncbi:uncharacterized protein L3040_009238 [Drepanopeziza brunnea f. sp. 'multigermtubi']|uniref:Uncharacterized protein n=1 Tax=Marssonina brunnea f. sp. multigermtubi (strain MB_m1) TaxID=1072389 RepID=K1X273_MARBU|nr:uncharacterized protein MBM_02558 [Drepanopeziza brunnea f. sp. 'multigermtubi' MB_m1]EKD19321.1 hypothetical protein MBM_02558 [Drepanopeziza brunnea f. sp. 'multigermtubi' MB_m1]KAJ5032642.1 hypothetical protein L3040_009238 [Drepanopeziza brunnea f. sp. 'multigermtubi']
MSQPPAYSAQPPSSDSHVPSSLPPYSRRPPPGMPPVQQPHPEVIENGSQPFVHPPWSQIAPHYFQIPQPNTTTETRFSPPQHFSQPERQLPMPRNATVPQPQQQYAVDPNQQPYFPPVYHHHPQERMQQNQIPPPTPYPYYSFTPPPPPLQPMYMPYQPQPQYQYLPQLQFQQYQPKIPPAQAQPQANLPIELTTHGGNMQYFRPDQIPPHPEGAPGSSRPPNAPIPLNGPPRTVEVVLPGETEESTVILPGVMPDGTIGPYYRS